VICAERPHAQRGYRGAVDAAGEPDDGAAALEVTTDLLANGLDDAIGLGSQIELKRFGSQGHLRFHPGVRMGRDAECSGVTLA
jgi:hypothetical protein